MLLSFSRITFTDSINSLSGAYALSDSTLTATRIRVRQGGCITARTQEVIPYPTQLNRSGEFWVPQDLTADRVVAHFLFIYADFFCSRVDFDDAWRKALLELFSMLWRNGLRDFDVREQAI